MTDGPRAARANFTMARIATRQEYDRDARVCMYACGRRHRSNIRDVNNATARARARAVITRPQREASKIVRRCEMETRCRCGNTTAIIS